MKKLLVTGSSGLIGSEVSTYFAENGWLVYGIDSNLRAVFFGPRAIPAGTSKGFQRNWAKSSST